LGKGLINQEKRRLKEKGIKAKKGKITGSVDRGKRSTKERLRGENFMRGKRATREPTEVTVYKGEGRGKSRESRQQKLREDRSTGQETGEIAFLDEGEGDGKKKEGRKAGRGVRQWKESTDTWERASLLGKREYNVGGGKWTMTTGRGGNQTFPEITKFTVKEKSERGSKRGAIGGRKFLRSKKNQKRMHTKNGEKRESPKK